MLQSYLYSSADMSFGGDYYCIASASEGVNSRKHTTSSCLTLPPKKTIRDVKLKLSLLHVLSHAFLRDPHFARRCGSAFSLIHCVPGVIIFSRSTFGWRSGTLPEWSSRFHSDTCNLWFLKFLLVRLCNCKSQQWHLWYAGRAQSPKISR